jgi:serine/threonine protein kinase
LAKVTPTFGSSGHIAAANTVTRSYDDHYLTSPGSAVGTVAYMSPEQARAKELYEMATGQMPFRGESSAVIFHAILDRPQSRPSA